MTHAPTQSYVPPRPNLGPEPWAGQGRASPLWILGAIAILLLVGWRITRKRTSIPSPIATPIETWQAAAFELRRRAAERFGADWVARTSEEILEGLRARNCLSSPNLELVGEILTHADFIKFAGVKSLPLTDQERDRLSSLWKGLAEPLPAEPGPR